MLVRVGWVWVVKNGVLLPTLCLVNLFAYEIRVENLLLHLKVLLCYHLCFEVIHRPESQVVTRVHPNWVYMLHLIYFQFL